MINFQSVADLAFRYWFNNAACVGDGSLGLDFFYSTAVDVTVPSANLSFSWWIKEFPLLYGKNNSLTFLNGIILIPSVSYI
ncbi:hypothetical protein MFLAVUS_001919 [Mucor flavus]|uniref:Uncharacterized protein n=1 Tax=Mucor flavus TaxID=439312 RepID=A0ABP9YNU9_9FUNG